MSHTVLAYDFGASSGRAYAVSLEDGKMQFRPVHRFENRPLKLGSTMYWNVSELFGNIKHGMSLAYRDGGFDSIGIDTWGVDFGLVGSDGKLLEAPVHYRDKRTQNVFDYAFDRISKEEFYDISGNQIMPMNTAFQLMAVIRDRPELVGPAEKLLMMPDLFNFLLTGKVFTELSIASTTQLLNIRRMRWAYDVIRKIGLSETIFPEIIRAGKVVGELKPEIIQELRIPQVKVTAVCGHDTQCAAAAVPAAEDDYIFISCGTWSLFGTVTDQPIINEQAYSRNMTNEVFYDGRITFMKNIVGLWLLQESRHRWRKEGIDIEYEDMPALAAKAKPFQCFIDPNLPEFAPHGNIPRRVKAYCERTGQIIPKNNSQILRCIYESLALSHRQALEDISACTGKHYEKIYMVGGGSEADIICQMTADACGCTVTAGPSEATVFGNAAIQLVSLGDIPDMRTASRIIANSAHLRHFIPKNCGKWNEAYRMFKLITGK